MTRSTHFVAGPPLQLFGPGLRMTWLLLFCVIATAQIVPLPPLAQLPLYSYVAAKVIIFLILGFLTPLAFWRFSNLGFGVLFSIGVTVALELAQRFVPGHRTSYLELCGKLILLLLGFAIGIDTRHDRQIKLGPVRLRLRDPFFREID